MRRVSTAVLPEPAPATMSSGESSCRTASRCCGLRSETRSEGAITSYTIAGMSNTGAEDQLSEAEITQLRKEIDRLDHVILEAVKKRTEISRAIGRTRRASGGVRLVHTREVEIVNQFREEIGEEGPALAAILLRLGRGKLG